MRNSLSITHFLGYVKMIFDSLREEMANEFGKFEYYSNIFIKVFFEAKFRYQTSGYISKCFVFECAASFFSFAHGFMDINDCFKRFPIVTICGLIK